MYRLIYEWRNMFYGGDDAECWADWYGPEDFAE
jgi:hypothetical protein